MSPASRPTSPSASVCLLAALLAARAAFGLAYLGGALSRAPIPWYHPLTRAWSFAAEPEGFAMEWYGRTAVALMAAALAALLVGAAARRGPLARALVRPGLVQALARGVALILLLDFSYFGWIMMHPAPSPPGACPC